MAKLVISTQYKENYADEGQAPYWKFKGGSTYVVENLSLASIARIEREGIPTLTGLIESYSEMSQEYILGYEIVEDDKKVFEDWEGQNFLSYNRDLNRWVQREVRKIEYSSEVDKKIASWVMAEGGKREDYVCEYRSLKDGNWYTDQEIIAMRES